MLRQLSSVILSLKYWPGFRCQHKLLLAFIFFKSQVSLIFPLTITSTLKHPSRIDWL